MKKLLGIYHNSYMVRPTVYQVVLRAAIVLVLSLLWNRFIDHDLRGVRFAFEAFGVFFWVLVWFGYLKMDGVSILNLKKRDRKKRRNIKNADIVDFTDESINPMDELEDDEKAACRLVSNAIVGTLFLLLAGILYLI